MAIMDAVSGTGFGLALQSSGSCGSFGWKVNPRTTIFAGRSSRRPLLLSIRAKSAAVEFETRENGTNKFAGDNALSKLVRQIISIKPIYDVLILAARNVMMRTAEKNGIAWNGKVEELKASDVFTEKEKLENTAIVYPDYYTKSFHGYEDGNLSWQAAFEAEPATMALWKRTYPNIAFQEAGEIFFNGCVEAIQSHHEEFSNGLPVRDILDVGCSTGTHTRFLANHFNTAQVIGLDMSPYFLAVAQYREKQDCGTVGSRRKSIRFVHDHAENTSLPSKSFDIVYIMLMIHECPRNVTKDILKEAHRLLRPGGTLAITDHSPKSKVIQNLHPALFTLMKTTEPWLDEFYMLDLEAEMENCGFTHVRSILTTPRHFTCTGTVAF